MATISGCRHLKMNLKAKIYLCVYSTTQRCPNKTIKIFLLEGFFHLPLTVSNFFENSRRYSRGKVHHWYQRHRWQICHRYQRHRRQIFTPLSLALLIPVATIPAANLPPVSTTPVANCHRYQGTGGKFATGVIDTGGKSWQQYQAADTLK